MKTPPPTFYDLNEDQRVELAERAIAERRTLYERWATLEAAEAQPWQPRLVAAAEFLGNASGVVDMGCGTMTLEKFLAKKIAYFPVDVVARDNRTTICDFNREPPPCHQADAVACLGLLEYLFDVSQFLTQLAKSYEIGVFSYNVYTGVPMRSRMQHGWVNNYRLDEIEGIFLNCGWQIDASKKIDGNQFLWRLQKLNKIT